MRNCVPSSPCPRIGCGKEQIWPVYCLSSVLLPLMGFFFGGSFRILLKYRIKKELVTFKNRLVVGYAIYNWLLLFISITVRPFLSLLCMIWWVSFACHNFLNWILFLRYSGKLLLLNFLSWWASFLCQIIQSNRK